MASSLTHNLTLSLTHTKLIISYDHLLVGGRDCEEYICPVYCKWGCQSYHSRKQKYIFLWEHEEKMKWLVNEVKKKHCRKSNGAGAGDILICLFVAGLLEKTIYLFFKVIFNVLWRYLKYSKTLPFCIKIYFVFNLSDSWTILNFHFTHLVHKIVCG